MEHWINKGVLVLSGIFILTQLNAQISPFELDKDGQIGTFDIPPIPPESFFDVFIDIPLSALPPGSPENPQINREFPKENEPGNQGKNLESKDYKIEVNTCTGNLFASFTSRLMEHEGIYYSLSDLARGSADFLIPETDNEDLLRFFLERSIHSHRSGTFTSTLPVTPRFVFTQPRTPFSEPEDLRYNSGRTEQDRGFGHGFDSFFDIWIEVEIDTVILHGVGGYDHYFVPDGPAYRTDPGFQWILEEYAPNIYKLRSKHGLSLFFSDPSHYKVTSIADRNNNTMLFQYDTLDRLVLIIFPSGRQLSYQYAHDHVVAMTDLSSIPPRTTSLKYNVFNELTEIIDPMGHSTKLSYGYWSNLQMITDAEQDTMLIDYHPGKTVASVRCPEAGAAMSLYYNDLTMTTTVIDSLLSSPDQTTQYQYGPYTASSHPFLKVETVINPDFSTRSFEYDSSKNITQYTDENGEEWNYSWDSLGNMLDCSDPLGNTWQFTYEPVYSHMTSFTDANGMTTDLHYGPSGNLDSIVDPLGNAMRFLYDSRGNATSVTDRDGHTSIYAYDAASELMMGADPHGNSNLYNYDASGNLVSSRDKNNRYTYYSWDNDNRLIKVINPAGDSVTYSYDSKGRMTNFTDEGGGTSDWEYDALDRMVRFTDPMGFQTEYEYDQVSNLVKVADPAGYQTHFAYDARNRLVSLQDAIGGTQQFGYDPTGNPTYHLNASLYFRWFYMGPSHRLDSISDLLGSKVIFGYDANGNLTSYTDELGHTTTYSYDALNRRVQSIDPMGGIKSWTYDAEGHILYFADEIGYTKENVFNALGRMVQWIGPNGATEYMDYDAVGNHTLYTDPNGKTYQYQYDSMDRRIKAIDPDGEEETWGYDKKGNRILYIDKNLNQTNYTYNADDQVIERTDAKGKTDKFSYDSRGNLVRRIDRSNDTTEYAYDGLSRRISKTDAMGYTESYNYDLNGNLTQTTDGNGHSSTYTYDSKGRLISITDANGNPENYTYDLADNLIQVTDRRGNNYHIDRDDLNRPVRLTDPSGNSDSTIYDLTGKVTAHISFNGDTTRYYYSCCSLDSIVDPMGYAIRFERDSAGNIIKSYDALDIPTTYEYDGMNRLVRSTDSLDYSWVYRYDANGNEIYRVNKNGDTTRAVYDELNRVTERKDAIGNSTLYAYDETGNPVSVTDRRGNTRLYEYDGLNRLIRATDPLGNEVEYGYDGVGNMTVFTDQNDYSTTFSYDNLNRLVSRLDALSNSRTYSYDPVGNLLGMTDEMARVTTYSYDPLNRLIGVTDANGNSASRTYDPDGNLVTETDRNAHATSYTYDGIGRMVLKTDPLGHSTAYTYDANSNMVQYTDALSHTRLYQYDALNRRTVSQDPLGLQQSYIYDGMDNVVRRVDANNDTTRYFYNKNQRVTRVLYPDGSEVKTVYDTEMLPLQLVGTGGTTDTTNMTYDANKRVTSAERKYGSMFTRTMQYTYDPAGNRLSRLNGTDSTTYAYDSMNRLIRIVNPALDTFEIQYNAAGFRAQLELANGTRAQYLYDNNYWLAQLTWMQSDLDTIVSFQYQYDNEGNKTIAREIYPSPAVPLVSTYSYDPDDRLAGVSNSWGTFASYVYDNVGNRILKNENGAITNYSYDAANRLMTEMQVVPPAAPINYFYDNNGNLVMKQTSLGPTIYDYDYENRLLIVLPPASPPVTYEYFANGQKMSRTASPPEYYGYNCYYCPRCCQWYCEVSEMYNSAGNEIASYTCGPFTNEHLSQQVPADSSYFVSDAQGSVRIALDHDETTIGSWEYDVFGNVTGIYGSSSNHFLFQGKEYDHITGQYDFVNRQYSPAIGRFTSQDPLFTSQLSHCTDGCLAFPGEPFDANPRMHLSSQPIAAGFFDPGSDPFEGTIHMKGMELPAPMPPMHRQEGTLTGSMENLYAFVGNNPASFIDPLGLSYTHELSRYFESNGSGSCSGGGCGTCGSGLYPGFKPYGGICLADPNGTASCDLSKKPCSDIDIKINNKKCTKECTQEHEDKHAQDIKDCCDKGRAAYENVKNKWADTYRSRNLGAKSLEKKLAGLDNDRNVQKDRQGVAKQWESWGNGARAWAECRAYQVSVECAERLWKEKNCDCPAPEDKECCKDIKNYKNEKEEQRKQECQKKSASNPPACPFK